MWNPITTYFFRDDDDDDDDDESPSYARIIIGTRMVKNVCANPAMIVDANIIRSGPNNKTNFSKATVTQNITVSNMFVPAASENLMIGEGTVDDDDVEDDEVLCDDEVWLQRCQ
jgi:hypothetical protein